MRLSGLRVEPTDKITVVESEKYLEFKVDGKLFAYNINKVAEIMEFPEIESIPLSPGFLLGAINLRGNVIPIIDLAICLNRTSTPVTAKTCVVISDVDYQGTVYKVGNKVDIVTRVMDIETVQIDKAPDLAGQLEHRVLVGVAKLDNRLLSILNVDSLMTHAQLDWLKESQFCDEHNLAQSQALGRDV